MKDGFRQYYDEATEPNKRERAFAWATAIGLQDVDGLKTSEYLLKTAKRHIEGEISQADARRLVDEYYETKESHGIPDDIREADKVSTRMIEIIESPTFNFSVPYYLGLHRKIFGGVFKFAGKIREVELTKREWVLNGDTVQYTPSYIIKDTLAYDFEQEKKFKYKGLTHEAFIEHFASFISGIWQIHPFREGNTRTTALFAIKYLQTKGFTVTNDLFAEKSYYFRNALVRANYENARQGIEKTQKPLENFFKTLIYGDVYDLKNRFLRIGFKDGMQNADFRRPPSKLPIQGDKLPIQDEKLPIDLNSLPIQNLTKRHIERLFKQFGTDTVFGSSLIASTIGIKDRAARNLLNAMRKFHIVTNVVGHGKGKVRFTANV